MNNPVIESIKIRRSQYKIGKKLPLPRQEVEELIKDAVKYAPSPFNSQTSRAVILFGSENAKLWNIIKEALRKIVPADSFAMTEEKISNFAAGVGTVLFYEDTEIIEGLQKQFPLYADNFPVWSEQSSGMAQFAVWTTLANANIGASLQHYNPIIDADIVQAWAVPAHWKLRAQMPFGSNEAEFSEKSFIDNDIRFKIYG